MTCWKPNRKCSEVCLAGQIPYSERQGIRHHLLDILPAHAEFSAGDFFDLARTAIKDVLQVIDCFCNCLCKC